MTGSRRIDPPSRAPFVFMTRHGDYLLMMTLLVVFFADASTMSYWGPTSEEALLYADKTFGTEMRAASLGLQFLYIGLNIGYLGRAVRHNRMLTLLIAMLACSLLWSAAPVRTLTNVARITMLCTSVSLARERHGAEAPANALYLLFGGAVILQVISLLNPGLSFMTGLHAGQFRGFFKHKNTFGAFFSVGAAVLISGIFRRDLPYYARVALAVLTLFTIVGIVLSRSATSLSIVGVIILFTPIHLYFRHRRSRRLSAWATIIGTVAIGSFLAAGGLDIVLGLVGRDSTFTDRSTIWKFVMRYIMQKPVLGWGMNSLDLQQLLNADKRGGEVFVVGSAHNSYLDIALGTGVVGLAIFFAWVLSMIARATAGQHPRLPFVPVAIGYLLTGVTESAAGLLPDYSLAVFLLSCPPVVVAARAAGRRSEPGVRRMSTAELRRAVAA